MSSRALIVLAPGFEDLEAIAPLDVLTRCGVHVTVASLTEGPVAGAYGSTLLPQASLKDISGMFEAVILPGGKRNAQALAADTRVLNLVRAHLDAGKIVAAICASPSHVLAEGAGIVQGRRATGDPAFMDRLAACGARIQEEPTVVDGNLITSRGPGTALDFALTIASELGFSKQAHDLRTKWLGA